jgi:Mlc titration factor MtfA (ptsG expression regulator)
MDDELLGCLLGQMFGFTKRRRKRLAGRPFPEAWLAILHRNVPLYGRMPQVDQEELRRHILIFLGEKRFEGCAGLEITDEVRVTIAAHACILLLHRQTDYYPGLSSILVYPHAYAVPAREWLPNGMVIEGVDVRQGESWHHGSVVLSWDSVRRMAADRRACDNVVLHEFAHQLDSSWGRGDSTPILQSRSTFVTWARVLQKEYDTLRSEVSRRRQTLLDDYGATNPAEFFAVATECFFQRPQEMLKEHPELYQELRQFYQQDPASL